MTLAPFLSAPAVVQIHILAALIGLGLGPVIICARSRGRAHKIMGYIWVMVLAVTALSSFAILEIRLFGPFSPLHGLSLLTLYTLIYAIRAARLGRISAHRSALVNLYAGLLVAGVFTTLPGRRMAEIIAPDAGWLAFALCVAAALALGAVIRSSLARHFPNMAARAA